MKSGIPIVIVGGIMFILGLIMFYSIETGQTDSLLRMIKHAGTFVGLGGMGVTLAGILIYLINRNQPPIKEHFDA